MDFGQYAVPPDLAPWVESIWTLRGVLAPDGQVILPDGRMELVIHFGAPPRVNGAAQPESVIAGQLRSALVLSPNGWMDALGVRLRPEAGGCLAPAADLAGSLLDLQSVLGVWARRLREEIGNSADRPAAVVQALRRLLAGAIRPDPLIHWSIRAIEASHGCGGMDSFVPGELRIRQWERRFLAAAGITPKALARIARLQHVVALHEAGEWVRWADIAAECGFYDQAHMANDFRAFSGQSPDAYFRAGRGMVEFYRDGKFQDAAR
ncbi:MAG: AraC family transcriptional regulator [Acidobacteria bacterium]|nr:AraC family transcriptional regulator [Acidobacteriota bacterium]